MAQLTSLPSQRTTAHVESSALALVARSLVFRKLAALRHGELAIYEGGVERRFGSGQDGIRAEVRIHAGETYVRTMLGGTLGFAEALLDGLASTPDPVALARLFVANRDAMDDLDSGLAKLRTPLDKLYHGLRRNTEAGSRRNIHAHYDLGNDFFSLFLDESLMYSSALFDDGATDLHAAQLAKLRRICDKLALSSADHVLEIGSGWGGFAIYAASRYGCRVTTTTISREQFELARKRVTEAGLDDRVTVLLEDYRNLRGRYDKLVSIEMVEAVGHDYYDTYFAQCGRLLAPHGAFVLQAITIEDRFYASARDSVDFIKRYVFPGCTIPCVSVLADSVARSSDLRITHLEDFGPHYATTLAHWRTRFHAALREVRALGFDERFVRMWDWYLASCEAGFEQRLLGVSQLVLSKPGGRTPPYVVGIQRG